MLRKKCSVRGFEYDQGSFSDIIHQYIDASTPQDLQNIKNGLSGRINELIAYSDGVLSEFIPHFKERFKKINIRSDKWTLEIDKWNWMGIALGQLKVFKSSEAIYRALYEQLCDLQKIKGRLSKGTPLHQIGWVDLLRETQFSLKRSQYYMKLAMLEDKITDITQGTNTFKNLPAYKVLKGEHNLSDLYLEKLAGWVDSYKEKHPRDPLLRPELIFLENIIDQVNQERSSLYDLDSGLARQMFNQVKLAKKKGKKGESLEILMAYLFLTSPGFEVLRNITSFDGQIDLLIRNLHTADPIFGVFGKYIIVECKNMEQKVSASVIRDFAAKVIQASCNSGILIFKTGISGGNEKQAARDARMAILKVHQRHGVIIIPLAIDKIKVAIDRQAGFLDLLIFEYEKIRFDIP